MCKMTYKPEFPQSIPEDMQFCPNVNPACYKSKEEVSYVVKYCVHCNKNFVIVNLIINYLLGCSYPSR